MTPIRLQLVALFFCYGQMIGCTASPPAEPAAAAPHFSESAAELGIVFDHNAGLARPFFMPQIMGSGVALVDVNNDGLTDAYFVNFGSAAGHPSSANALFVQQPDGSFIDATGESGAGDRGLGMGCAAGDVDNDGDPDLLITNYGPNTLLLNQGNGVFEPGAAGLFDGTVSWSTSAAFFDFDRDGWLDIYIANYVQYDSTRQCHDTIGRPDFCGPEVFVGAQDRLLRNQGGGQFRDVSEETGISRITGKGLGVLAADFDDDGWPDVFVANDGEANQLWMNRQGRFVDEALVRGVAFNMSGKPEASMGVAAGDIDGDGDLDLFMTHLDRETNTLYLNLGAGEFEDRTPGSGLDAASLPFTGFATLLFDVDWDGLPDLFVANGRVRRGDSAAAYQAASGDSAVNWTDYQEPNQLFQNRGEGRFSESGLNHGVALTGDVSRGAAVADLDRDGDLDIVVSNCNGSVRVHLNQRDEKGHWLGVRAFDPELGRDAIGARITVYGGSRLWRGEISRTMGYLSSSPPVAWFGLGARSEFDRIAVRWPDGGLESFPGGTGDRQIELRRGNGTLD